ncbi:sigma54 specific transcriptional regulator, Fis family [Clostridium aceticum]|uniref:HTH-type transcriptional regulatory protein TyrR n=1 Tax=Clostridium aceticum TaxID=84022 RepID=A0A0D8IF70_9CLOT|nr:sigma 54-interacting transcriptional regulator [Clostridium aceticum]AKL93948.1 sigma54 specific transcriptional regulator, Fis family [Clostridium aceticum]KJF28667.1 Fis family transcriptional regulator [Clostridium aceticum]
MNGGHTIKISQKVKKKIDELAEKTGLDINDLIDQIIEENKIPKKKQLDAFTIANSIADGIYVIDKNGMITAVNKRYLEIKDLKEEDVIGKHIDAIWDKNINYTTTFIVGEAENKTSTLEMVEKSTNKTFKIMQPRAISIVVLEEKKKISVITTAKGREKSFLITSTPFFDDEGEVAYVLTVLRDLTELVELKKKLDETESEKNRYLHELEHIKEHEMRSALIGESMDVEKIRELIESVAKTDATVLITGETGVGKEVIAREIYKHSKRKDGPYIKVNCAAIPETLLESELFGYEKGAFTGAQNKEKLGFFEMANNGTILLDEIGEIPIRVQSKLLRVLQEREVTRIGGTRNISLNVRVLAATNQNLQEQIEKGAFRQDLYYRLNVVPIRIPPLREREGDITLLAYNFLEDFNQKYHKKKVFEIDAIEALEHYDWPGNVRELENTVERLVIIGEKKAITRNDIVNIFGKNKFLDDPTNSENMTLREAVDAFEKKIIEKALKKYGSTYKAAKVLGVAQPTVLRKARSLGVEKW